MRLLTPLLHVLDASAILALLRKEPGQDVVADLLADTNNVCLAHAINLCEVYYDFVRNSDVPTARQVINSLPAQGIVAREDMDVAFWQSVGELKVSPGKISLADCCGLALALRLGAPFVTSDHSEFDPVAAMVHMFPGIW